MNAAQYIAIPIGKDAQQIMNLGHQLSQQRKFAEAEACYRQCIAIDPGYAMAYNNLAWVQQMQGNYGEAYINYKKALQLDPQLKIARRNFAISLVKMGRVEESLNLWNTELASGDEGLTWITKLMSSAMRQKDLSLAGEYATILATLKWGSKWYPKRNNDSFYPPIPGEPPITSLTIPKLRHDVEQFHYLQNNGILKEELTPIIEKYERIIERLEPVGPHGRTPIDDETKQSIGEVYNRIIHIRDTPKVSKALSGSWDPTEVEKQFLNPNLPGLVVIDNFLSKEALENLRLFCLESTVWSANRYAHGRLGAFFQDGFNCPLLLQIAEELRASLPKIITDRYPLRQIWGFKNGQYLPADSTIHADFAAVNVNIWITPEDANLDQTSGGLVVYGIDAPLGWDFYTYNGRLDIIKSFLKQQKAQAINIPYRQNRALIFNSDLFHSTAGLRFKPGYENRRINVTFLYGDREDDQHHRNLAHFPDPKNQSRSETESWRSAAFSHVRNHKLKL